MCLTFVHGWFENTLVQILKQNLKNIEATPTGQGEKKESSDAFNVLGDAQ